MKVCSFPPHRLIVLNNVPYHGIQSNKPLTFILKIFKLKTGFTEIIQIMRKQQTPTCLDSTTITTMSQIQSLEHSTIKVYGGPHTTVVLNVTEFICNIIKI